MKKHDTPEKQYDLERLIFFSDGVFAIAITLLVIEMHPPEHWDGTLQGLVNGIATKIICYVVSFGALAAFWTAHRFIFRHVERFTEPASLLNLLFLLTMSLVPFVNALLVDHMSAAMAINVYVGLVVLSSAAMALLWAYLALISQSINPAIGWGFRWLVLARFLIMPPLLAFTSIWMGRHFGPLVAIVFTAAAAALAGHFGVKPVPTRPEVKEL